MPYWLDMSKRNVRFAVVHAATPGGNPRQCLMGWYSGSSVEPSYGSYAEALTAARHVSAAHGGAPAMVVTANRKLDPVYGPVRG